MKITMEALLLKIEEELNGAKMSKTDDKLRERIYAIKTLCELALKERGEQQRELKTVPLSNVQPMKKTVELDEDGNGDSIFDF